MDEQAGQIRVVKNGALLATPFLDVSARLCLNLGMVYLGQHKTLEARAYTWALPTMFFHLEAELTKRNLIADIICDEGNEERGFRLSELLKTFQESGVFQRIKKVIFRPSETEVGLQIADIHAYAMIRTQGLQKGFVTRKTTDQLLERMVNDFTDKQCQLVSSKPLDTRQRGLATMLSIEYIIRHSGLPTEVIQTALEISQQVLDEIAPI